MDASDFVRLLNTDHYSPANLEEVNNLCRNYSMFNLAHMLKVRIKEALGHDKEADLKVAAVYSSDRRKLYQLVTEVVHFDSPEQEEEIMVEESGGIQFSEEPHEQADVIIEQHAPYAGPKATGDLLELDEENEEDRFTLEPESEDLQSESPVSEDPVAGEDDSEDTGPEEELTSETLIEAVVKEETEMEEPGPERMKPPVIDVVVKEETEIEAPVTEQTEPPVHESVDENKKLYTNDKLILNFINDDPGPIRADKKTSIKGDVSISSIREHDGFITDTLAQIYVKQGLYAKAIYAYEKLSLKYPEKSAYFAAQIEKIKNINYS
jgi:hypothetical protein